MYAFGSSLARTSSLFSAVKLQDDTEQAGLLRLYEELKEFYEAQERAVPPAEYAIDQDEELKQLCTQASLLFVARVLFVAQSAESRTVPANLGCPISRIVAATGINLLDFFREVNLVVSKLSTYFEARGGSSKRFTQQALLKENSETVVVMGLLAKKYKDNFNMFLHQLDLYKQFVLKLGWSAFLVLRVKLLSAFPDVVSCVELLPCVFAVLASHAPRLPDCLSHLERDEHKQGLLKTISEMCKADYGRVRARMPGVEALLSQILTAAVPEWRTAMSSARLQAQQATVLGSTAPTFGGALDLVLNPVLEGLVTDADRIQRAVAAMEAEYEQHYALGGSELDEREFLHTDFAKFASPRFSPGRMYSAMSKLRAGPMPLRQGALLGPGAHTTAPYAVSPHLLHFKMPSPSGVHSPLPMLHLSMDAGGQPNTPVSELMSASSWLRGVTANLASEASPGLLRYLAVVAVPAAAAQSACMPGSSSAAQQLGRRVRDLVSSIMPDEKIPSLLGPFPLLQSSLAAERRTEVTKLYYHSLENILQGEEKSSGLEGITSLLSAGNFHRALVACCVEVVAACYRMVSCAFPKVLDALHIKAFDLARMIQSFVKSIATLPRELKRHLFLIEERILESLAWEPGSSLYSHITNNACQDGAVLQSPTSDTAAAEEDPLRRRADGSMVGPSLSVRTRSGGDAGVQTLNEGEISCKGAVPFNRLTDSGEAPMNTPEVGIHASSSRAPATEANSSALSPPPKRPKTCMFFGVMSPAKKARGADGSPQPTQLHAEQIPQSIGTKLLGALESGGSAGALYDFCRKVLKLSAFRLALMCDNFDFSPLDRVEVNIKVYETIEYALYSQTHLFYNRHIDQIVLSALYGYCKVHKLSQVSFREIIAHYRKQPQAQQSIFRSVIIEQSNPGLQVVSRADIIAFYNQIFVPAMKFFLLKGESNGARTSGHCMVSTTSKAGDAGNMDASAASAFGGSRPISLPLLTLQGVDTSPRALKISSLPTPGLPVRGADRLRSHPERTEHMGGEAAGGVPLSSHTPMGGTLDLQYKGNPSSQSVQGVEVGIRPPTTSTHSTGTVGLPGRASMRTKSPVEHQIPDGLAALLQALDSATQDIEYLAEFPTTKVDEGDDKVRRVARRLERQDVAKEEGVSGAVDGSNNVPLPKSPAFRRHRTPNRRY